MLTQECFLPGEGISHVLRFRDLHTLACVLSCPHFPVSLISCSSSGSQNQLQWVTEPKQCFDWLSYPRPLLSKHIPRHVWKELCCVWTLWVSAHTMEGGDRGVCQNRVGGAAGRVSSATGLGERIANCQVECEEKEQTPSSLASWESICHKLEETGSLVILSLCEEKA